MIVNITKIYLVTNCYEDPNKVYIGKTKNCRKAAHRIKFGKQIEYSYIDEVNSLNRGDWEPLETYWIEQFKQWGFEIMNKRKKGGSGPEFMSDISKEKISKILKGKLRSKEAKHNISESLKGRKLSKETKEKISKIQQEGKFNLGKKRTEETKQKMSESHLGKKSSKIHKQNISKALKGIPKPDGFGENHSKILKGIPKPDGFGEKLSKIKTGVPLPLGTGIKIGKTKEKPVIQFNKEGDIIGNFDSAKKAAEYICVHEVTMRLHLGGKYKTCKKFIFKYKDNG